MNFKLQKKIYFNFNNGKNKLAADSQAKEITYDNR